MFPILADETSTQVKVRLRYVGWYVDEYSRIPLTNNDKIALAGTTKLRRVRGYLSVCA